MSGTKRIEGKCLCGAVTVSALVEEPNLRACHCEMCRKHTSGMFEDAAGGEMTLEFYADKCPQGYELAGEHRKLTTEETEALFAPNEE